ncbi:MAG: glutamate--tRNA ligase [Chloroflexota bacterium]|nr:glutamate--tRNA ligase [Dehalococcoidia bacterium]MDW8255157.1 glutamate--tRNA ligase [Chloroflexota bacterium]
MTVRVRFAPSPTGYLHIGTARTVLFNWLFARHCGGAFVLRIEDTDKEREVPGAVDNILESLAWLGLDPDEGPGVGGPYGPYVQSERLDRYHEVAQALVEAGKAYPCFCSTEELAAMRERQRAEGRPPGYDRRCRALTSEERAARAAALGGRRPVIRFAMPLEGKTTWHDVLRGEITVDNSTLDDFVMIKSDGYPTYNFAHVVDDHDMAITHVMRAEEFVPSTPKFVQLYWALGWDLPVYVHLPDVLGHDKKKLSKRHGATAILEYRDAGYLPEAMVNYLALLGWAYDDRTEIMDRAFLIEHFTLDKLSKHGAVFNREKLDWFNGVYIRALSVDDLTDRLIPFLERDLPPDVPRPLDRARVRQFVPLIQERLVTLGDAPALLDFAFVERPAVDPALYALAAKGVERDLLCAGLLAAAERLAALPDFAPEPIETELRALAAALGLKVGQLFGAIRVAVTGKKDSPPLHQTVAALGREVTLERLRAAADQLQREAVA